MSVFASNIVNEVNRLQDHQVYGRVTSIVGLLVEVGRLQGSLSIGDHCLLRGRDDIQVLCEVVGFKNERALLLPFGPLGGIGLGCSAEIGSTDPSIYPHESWLGRVINAFGEPVDGKGPLNTGEAAYPIHWQPPNAHSRRRVSDKIDTGVRSINTFLTCCRGQRMGIFSGSGIGKSTILSMMASWTDAEVSAIGLIGERGREAREFIEDYLGEEGLARSVVILALSDEPPLVRRQAAYVMMATAEYFRDQGSDVLCLMDSITRFAMAQREISLSAGEPPASKGYTPSVFAELPKLLERAGPGLEGQGTITGMFSVLVEGDDHNEPVSDSVRGILDGHIVLDREIAERGRYPAVNVLRSISRVMPDCNTEAQNAIVTKARKVISTYEDMAELIRLGAYRTGSDPEVDFAIRYYPALEQFLSQLKTEASDLESGYEQLAEIMDMQAVLNPEPVAPPEQPATNSAPAQAPQQPNPGDTPAAAGTAGPLAAAVQGLPPARVSPASVPPVSVPAASVPPQESQPEAGTLIEEQSAEVGQPQPQVPTQALPIEGLSSQPLIASEPGELMHPEEQDTMPESELEPEQEAEPKTILDAELLSESEAEPEPDVESAAEPGPELGAEPDTELDTEPDSELGPDPDADIDIDPATDPNAEN